MGNLLGQPFDPWVKKQIETRQSSLGEYTNISSKNLQYYHTKTPFLRLASAVNLTNKGALDEKGNRITLENSVLKKLIANGVPENLITGDALAKNFILQGGALSSNPQELNSGLKKPDNLFSGAYGWGGIEERGYVPMPGITQADVEYQNNGALTKTTVNIRCYSKAQFQLVDVLYLRPGYTVLLEFGWTKYLDNNGDLQNVSDSDATAPLSILLDPGDKNQYDMYKAISTTRKEYDGNYDAIYGKISNFNWAFNPDGSYDCTVQITGMGDVIESLKVNIASPKGDKEEGGEETEIDENDENPPLIANANKTVLNERLFYLYQFMKENEGDIKTYDYIFNGFRDDSGKAKKIRFKKCLLSVPDTTLDGEGQNPQPFMTFGSLLALIQHRLLLYDKKTNTPITRFDVNFENLEKDDNYILRFPGQFSGNPKVCLIPYTNCSVPEGGLDIPQTDLGEVLDAGAEWEAGVYAGRLANIYVNLNFIAETLTTAPKGEDNSLSVLAFLKSLIAGITEALGGINQITVRLSENGSIQFIEEVPQRTDDFEPLPSDEEYTRFNVFGVKPGAEGSFIRNISLNAEISSNFSTMIAIGAQSNGNQISANATSFSNYNAGLQDRLIEEKQSFFSGGDKNTPEKPTATTLKEHFDTNIVGEDGGWWGGSSLFDKVYDDLKWVDENVQSLVSHNSQYSQMVLGELSKNGPDQQLQAPFFLPFNLSLDIDGLSGMVLYQKFLMTNDILPPSYENDGVDLQLTGVNHSITPDAWITKLKTQSVPREKLGAAKRPPEKKSKKANQSRTTNGGGASGNQQQPPPPQNLPQDEKLRLKTYRIMDDGTQTLGYYEVLDENGNVLYNLAVSELPWKGNQNSISCIPTGNYRVKSHTSGKHGKCFWYVGNEAGNYAFDKLFGNGFIRTSVLIHRSPKAPGWLQGCQGPGFKFNVKTDQKGRQKGTGDNYLDPAKAQSQQAVDKLLGTLYSEGSFRATIENVFDPLPTSFNDPRVQQIIKEKQLI